MKGWMRSRSRFFQHDCAFPMTIQAIECCSVHCFDAPHDRCSAGCADIAFFRVAWAHARLLDLGVPIIDFPTGSGVYRPFDRVTVSWLDVR